MSLSSKSSEVEELTVEEPTVLHQLEEVSRNVMAEEVIESTDPLNDPNFNPIDYINSLFPTEQALSNVDDFMTQLKCKICNLDEKMRTVVRAQVNSERVARAVFFEVQQVICQLIHQVLEIRNTAERSEETVKEIIHDIKQLDWAKHNLTMAITTLNHLQILVRGIDTIRDFTDKRMYGEIVGPLQGIIEVIKHLKNYTGVTKVDKLISKLHEVQDILTKQMIQDFRQAVAGEGIRIVNPTKSLAEICLIVDMLDPSVKFDLLNWFIDRQLDEYLLLFNDNEESSWLDQVDRRYTWFKKHLIQFENKFAPIFPPEWEMSKKITVKFCQVTKSHLSNIMMKRTSEIDVKLLLYAFKKTSSFEHLLAVRFTGNTVLQQSNEVTSSNKTVTTLRQNPGSISNCNTNLFFYDNDLGKNKEINSAIDKRPSKFHNIISESFTPYFYIFIENLDKCLYEMMERFVADTRRDFTNLGSQNVLPSCADLFVFYRKFLVECSELSSGPPMVSLSTTFGKYLREYALKILKNNLPKLGGNSLSTGMTNITRDISSASSLIQNFFKEGEEAKFSKSEITKICCILATAEYCLETIEQLETKMKKKVDPFLSDKINLSREKDLYFSIISSCLQLLVTDIESACQPSLSAMIKVQWQSVKSAGDQSDYVTVIIGHLKTSVPLIKESLSSSRKYFIQFCVRFAKSFVAKFVQHLFKCKPLSVVGAEQLLLDTQTLKTALLELPTMGSQLIRKAPDCYVQVVIKSMSFGEKVLKLVMTPCKPEAAFVSQLFNLLPSSNIKDFQKILDMKGLRATDKSNLLTVFCIHHSTGFVANYTSGDSPKYGFDEVFKLENSKEDCIDGQS